MRVLSSRVVALLLLTTCLLGADSTTDRFQIPEVCSIATPGKGWAWKVATEYDKEKGGVYLCTKEGDPGKVVLIIDPRRHATDEQRIATLKAHFNALVDTLKNLGCPDSKGKRPELKPPIPDDVEYFVFGKTPQGKTVNIHAHTVFKTRTYLIQAAAPSLKEAETLAAVAKTLKE